MALAEKDVEAVKQLYGTRGYVAANVRVESRPDDSRLTVQYVVRISEGDVYRMGDLKIHGLDSKATARLAEVRHEVVEKVAKSFRISSCFREVYTTF